MKEIIALIVFFIVLGGMIVFGALEAIELEERNECLRWSKVNKEAPAVFFLTPTQKKQCNRWGIEIDAPIKSK